MLGQYIVIGDTVIFHGIGVLVGICAVHAIHILCQQDHVGVNFRRPQHRRRIRGKEGVAGTTAEDDHSSLLQMANGPGADIGLRHGPHLHRGLDPDGHIFLFQYVR